jgi:hypothetical protein
MMLVRRLVLAVFGSVLVAVGVGSVASAPALATGDANKAQCPSGTESSPGFRPYLPDCRAYELVTPPYKGSELVLGALDPRTVVNDVGDGGQLLTSVGGAFSGAGNAWWQGSLNTDFDVYEFTRGGSGWEPEALTPAAATYPYSTMMAAAPGLGSSVWGATTSNAYSGGGETPVDENIYVRNSGGEFSLVGPGVAPEASVADAPLEELNMAGASQGLTRLLFAITSNVNNSHSDVWPGDSTGELGSSLYEYDYEGVASAEPALVGVKNEGRLHGTPLNEHAELISRCSTVLGASPSEIGGSGYNAVSASGERVFFTAGACAGAPVVNEVYARVNGEHTVAVSEPSKEDCSACVTSEAAQNAAPGGALFEGASEDGSRVFFLSEQELLPGQKGMNLYEYDFDAAKASVGDPDGRIALVSAGSSEPEVQGVVRVAENGERVYFVAKGVLAGRNAEGKEPVKGADNLYVFDTANATTVFVGGLLSEGEEASIAAAEAKEAVVIKERAEAKFVAQTSVAEHEWERGEITEEQLDAIERVAKDEETAFPQRTKGTLGPGGTLGVDRNVWAKQDDRPAQATPDGGFLVFLSSANLTGDDSALVPKLFEYDAATERLTRVSIGQGGSFERDGTVETFRDAPSIPSPPFGTTADLPTVARRGLAVSDDGSRVFFTSAGRLVPEAVAGDTNVYEFEGGDVYLISDGRDGATQEDGIEPAVSLFGADPSGRNVYFTSADALVPEDAESQTVLYDAREEGGFPAPALAPGCTGDACQGLPSSPPAAPGTPASATLTGNGNLAPPAPAALASKPKPKSVVCKKGFLKKNNKCVKKKKAKKAKKAKRAGRDRRANS